MDPLAVLIIGEATVGWHYLAIIEDVRIANVARPQSYAQEVWRRGH
jgi:hypothetical protein